MNLREVCIACVWCGDKYSESYVEKLFAAVRRNCGTELPFFCLTDHLSKVESSANEPEKGVCFVRSPNTYPGWWQKINLFKRDLFGFRYLFYLDLDVVVLRELEPMIAKAMTFDFVWSQDVLDTLSTSCMFIDSHSEFAQVVFAGFEAEEWIHRDDNDQGYLSGYLDSNRFKLSSFLPEQHYSYKYFIDYRDWRARCCNPTYRPFSLAQLTTLNFHGEPNPHDLAKFPESWPYAAEILRHW